jgi:hypothetical protein
MDDTDRDRNAWGRAENARPRDRLGRPLPYDSDETELAEEFEHHIVEDALDTAIQLWDDERYFEAHECLEDVWHHAAAEDRDFWQGVVQVAVTCCHDQRGNHKGARVMAAKALDRLAGYPSQHRGIDVSVLRSFLEAATEGITSYLSFPAIEGGPWFTERGARTPLVRQPPWQAGAEQLAETADS